MKPLAIVFAGITLLAMLLGFAMDVIPILSLCGKVAAVFALAGFAITAVASLYETSDTQIPLFELEADGASA